MEPHCVLRRTAPCHASTRAPTLIYFIPGNPGLVDFYKPFLGELKDMLESSDACEKRQYHIYGENLAGFSDDDHEPFSSDRPPRDLEYQIRHKIKSLSELRVGSGPSPLRAQDGGAEIGQPYHDVILMGHSVGAYIALEVYHRLMNKPDLAPDVDVTAAILLFPTIEHIAQSANGQRLDLLRRTPVLGKAAPYIATAFLKIWPHSALEWFIRTVLGYPHEPAAVATNWLKSRDGLWQTLHLGMDEMKVIGEAKWDEELWEIANEAEAHHQPPPKFFFYFGKKDHWVNSQHRDDFIEKRRAQVERTRLMIDDGDLPHAFCISGLPISMHK